MRTSVRSRLGVSALVMGLVTALVPVAAHATDQTSTSTPTGRLTVRSSTLSLTNVDGDGNPDTATNGDVVEVIGSVANNVATQRVTLTVALDLPGNLYDLSVSKRVRLGGGKTEEVRFRLRVFRFIPRGAYTTSITADDGTESATATSSLTLN